MMINKFNIENIFDINDSLNNESTEAFQLCGKNGKLSWFLWNDKWNVGNKSKRFDSIDSLIEAMGKIAPLEEWGVLK